MEEEENYTWLKMGRQNDKQELWKKKTNSAHILIGEKITKIMGKKRSYMHIHESENQNQAEYEIASFICYIQTSISVVNYS